MSKEVMLPVPMSRTMYLPTQVSQESMFMLTKAIIDINQNDRLLEKVYALNGLIYEAKPINMMIDSYGGQAYQCFGLISVMKASRTPIHTFVTGCAMSCGFLILIHGNKRFGFEYSTPLYHQVSAGAMGKLKQMEESVAEAKRLQAIVEKMTLENTKITKDKLKEIYEKKVDWFMSVKEAQKLGVIDEIITHLDF